MRPDAHRPANEFASVRRHNATSATRANLLLDIESAAASFLLEFIFPIPSTVL
jgi:hypothetical protein